MFDEIFLSQTARKYQTAPLTEQRIRYLLHLKETGSRRLSMRSCANAQLALVRLLDLREGDRVSVSRIEAAAAIWSRPKGRQCSRAASLKARKRFIGQAVRWLRFLGWLDESEAARHPYGREIDAYVGWLRSTRGLSERTIVTYRAAADQFLDWLAKSGGDLVSVRMTDIDDAIAAKKAQGTCSRRSMHDYAQCLRAFFRFAEGRGWCMPGLAAGLMPPRFMRDEGVPKGLKREDVLRLLATTQGDRPADKRDRAILMLLITYGLRAGEVAGLELDDLDWDDETLRVHRPKTGRTDYYPLSQAVGQAILRYLRDVRPSGFGRTLFLTINAPIRPLGRTVQGKMVRDRLERLGITTGRRGTHALRHSAAQHLLDQGLSMKVIGDFLGHRDPSSTTIYAKVDLGALREVADFDLGGLA